MFTNIINQTEPIVKIRPNLFQLPTGHVIGFGAILAPGGLGYCFTCNEPDCPHVATVDPQGGLAEPCEDWLAGGHSVEDDEAIPFDGSVPDEPLYYDDEELLFASSADLYGLNEVTL